MKLPESRIKLTLAATVVIFLVAIGISKLTELTLGLPEQNQVEVVKKLVGWNLGFLALSAWVLVATPIIEESVFRLPVRWLGGWGWSAVLSAVFSFCHYIDFARLSSGKGFALTPLSNAFIALFFVGMAWCWLYRRTGRIWCTMLSHCLFNTINLALVILMVVMGWDR